MKVEISKGFQKKLSRRIERYEFEVGIQDAEYKEPLVAEAGTEPMLGSYAGGPVRKKTRIGSGKKISEILTENMDRMNINIFLKPFHDTKSEFARFVKSFLQMAVGMNVKQRRVENLLQAIVRNPILRQEYGTNKGFTADVKGFDRHLIDTAQTFKAIKAKVIRRV